MKNTEIFKMECKIKRELGEIKSLLLKKEFNPTEKPKDLNNLNDFINILLKIPTHLKQSYLIMIKVDRLCMAQDVSDMLNIGRAMASKYLNELIALGYLKKHREGKRVMFSLS